MRIDIDYNSCFRADEIIRIGRAIKYQALREKYRAALLQDIDLSLPDYPRPTKKIERKIKGVRLITIIKTLLP